MANSAALRRRTVARRVLLSYVMVMTAFALVAGWSATSLRRAAHELELMRSGYLPLALALHDLVAIQNNWNTQLNHITTAKNPTDIRVWMEFARVGRLKEFSGVRDAIAHAFIASGDESTRRIGGELLAKTASIQHFAAADGERLGRLFLALEQRDPALAERLRDDLTRRGIESKRRLDELERQVRRNVDGLHDQARNREKLATRLLFALAVLTLLVGVVMALYTQRVLQPLGRVTERAKAVARGDLTPRPVVATNDEIGELATTFENMVSAIARAREQILAAERLAAIGKMAAHVTHEIRNPLSSMALNLELLEEELGPGQKEARDLLSAIGGEVERLTGLSEEYLSVARRQPLRLEEEDLGQLVREAAEFMRRDLSYHGVETRLELDSHVRQARVDEAQLKQALFNLLRNAREAMPNGGAVTVGVRPAADGGVDITVDDQGSGIDEHVRERLFEPFFTTKDHGTGLGLAITRQIVQGHGGEIRCLPRDSGGTRIWIHLPAVRPVAPVETAPAEQRDAV